MDKKEIIAALYYLVDKYIEDDLIKKQLNPKILQIKSKYILSKIDNMKKIPFTEDDLDLIKDIVFYTC